MRLISLSAGAWNKDKRPRQGSDKDNKRIDIAGISTYPTVDSGLDFGHVYINVHI